MLLNVSIRLTRETHHSHYSKVDKNQSPDPEMKAQTQFHQNIFVTFWFTNSQRNLISKQPRPSKSAFSMNAWNPSPSILFKPVGIQLRLTNSMVVGPSPYLEQLVIGWSDHMEKEMCLLMFPALKPISCPEKRMFSKCSDPGTP